MNKKEIKIIRVNTDGRTETNDYVAVEKKISFKNSKGQIIELTCSPGYEEELITGHIYTETDRKVDIEFGSYKLQEISNKELLGYAEKVISIPQELFEATGCAHSCGLVYNGEIICHMEDIKRHNALDKAVGYAVMNGIPLNDVIVITSGRASLDYLEKAAPAGVRAVVSRAAVTDAAVDFAKEKNMTLLGFARNGRANLYHEGNIKIVYENSEEISR